MINFDTIVGQEKPIQILKNLISSGKVGHAYLFMGREGIGKKLVAISFAKAVNCLNLSKNYEACNHCSNCLKIEKNIHPDTNIISALNSVISIGQIRELKNTIYWQPLESRKKVFIIDDAHRMTADASNSLLKILEEPPPYAILILTTSEPKNLLDTIISRCHLISFQPLKKIGNRKVLTRKNQSLEKNNRYIDWLLRVNPEQAFNFLFSMSESEMKDITDSFLDFIEVMILWFRDILFLQLGLSMDNFFFPDRIDSMKDFTRYYSQEKIINILDYLTQIPEKIEKYVNTKILLENFMAQIGDL